MMAMRPAAPRRRGLISLTAIACVLSAWTYFVFWEMARTWAVDVVWWAGLPVLAAGPLSLLALYLSFRLPRKTVLIVINALLSTGHACLWVWLTMPDG